MKIVTVVGARPQFIKAAVVSHELAGKHDEILVHTGQHYDYNMSGKFFEELGIPIPKYNLGISGGTHAEMTAKMMISLEKVLLDEKPDWVLLYGDTNSTLAAAIVAAKVHIRICHVEAGTRFHVKTNPEEINRICTDHLSSLLFACTESSMEELHKEGLGDISYIAGDPMYDAFIKYSGKVERERVALKGLDGNIVSVPKEYYYLTCHREENTNRQEALNEIFKAMNSLDAMTIYPVHPRNKERAIELKRREGFSNIVLVEPVGYLESISLVKNAKKIVTDSGGLQREAFFAEKKCVTILDFVVWPETMCGNRNQLARPEAEDILYKLKTPQVVEKQYQPFGNGSSASRIVDILTKFD